MFYFIRSGRACQVPIGADYGREGDRWYGLGGVNAFGLGIVVVEGMEGERYRPVEQVKG